MMTDAETLREMEAFFGHPPFVPLADGPREDERYPGFEAQHGRKPVAGKDYNPDGELCQDDAEYLGGFGSYY